MTKTKYLITKNVILFCFNYPSYEEVIDYMMTHPKSHTTREHLIDAITYYLERYSGAEAWLLFFCYLDGVNQEIFTDYICEIYAKQNIHDAEDLKRINM